MNNSADQTPFPSNLPPLVAYVYGLFKSHSLTNEFNILQKFAGRKIEKFEQPAMDILPQRIAEAFISHPVLSEEFINWILNRREITNYTYELSSSSRTYLASFVAAVAGIEFETADEYIRELEEFAPLKEHIRDMGNMFLPQISDQAVFYGRRLGWYALARIKKPKIIIETGVDKGMGSCILALALIKNELDGYPGRYFGLDINQKAGAYFRGDLQRVGEIIYGDSVTTLSSFPHKIDFLIADSSHAEGYEGKEYAAIKEKLSPDAVLISDADRDALAHFALQTKRKLLYWPEWPQDHFYPGAGIAIAYR